MKVLGVGLGRTGCASLKVAFELLGFGPCYNMRNVIDEPERARAWTTAAENRGPGNVGDGGPVDWDSMLAGFESTTDWPGAAFWRELVDHWPEAKVVLTVRDPEVWCESISRTIFRPPTRLGRVLARAKRRVHPHVALVYPMIRKVVVQGVFGGATGDRDHLLAVFRRHTEAVVAHVGADRLLVFDVRQGWEPLCRFLDVPVPPGEFPTVNSAEEFRRKEWSEVGWAGLRRLTYGVARRSAAARRGRTWPR